MSRKYIGVVVAVVAVVAMVGYLATQRDVLDAIQEIPLWMAIVLVAVSGAALVVQAMQYRAAVKIQAIDVPIGESTALTAANTMANYYLPVRGGMVVRAAYMKRVYAFPLARYGALTISITGLTILVAALIGVVGVVISASTGNDVNQRALLTFAGIGIAVVGGVVTAVALAGLAQGDGRFAETVRSFRAGMAMWAEARGRLGIFLIWTVALFAAQGFRLWLAFRVVGVSVDLSGMMIIQATAAMAFVLALTPGNVGIREGAVVFSASLLNIDPDLALLASLIDRGAALIVTFGVGLSSVHYLSTRTAFGSTAGENRIGEPSAGGQIDPLPDDDQR